MIPLLAVSDETIKRAKSLTDIRGLRFCKDEVMDEILGSVRLSKKRFLHIGSLSRHSLLAMGIEDMNADGYFLFECSDEEHDKGISVLGQTPNLEAAFRLIEIWEQRLSRTA